jgi:uncharacterized protein YggU (UPF0235/DUF167 family)
MSRKKKYRFHDGEKGAALAIHVKLGRAPSSFSKVLRDGTVVVKIRKGEGNLNNRLLDFISNELDIPQDQMQIIAGDDGNKKLISIIGEKPNQLQMRILEKIA